MELDVQSWQFANNRRQFADRQCNCACFTDICTDAAADAHVQICRRQGNTVIACLNEHIAQDRHCRPAAYNIEDLLQAAVKVIAVYFELHG